MKQAVNFRLSQQSILTLTTLANTLDLTRTQIIERALLRYYERKLKQKPSPLLALAGSINDDDTKSMLKCIKNDRVNKSADTKL